MLETWWAGEGERWTAPVLKVEHEFDIEVGDVRLRRRHRPHRPQRRRRGHPDHRLQDRRVRAPAPTPCPTTSSSPSTTWPPRCDPELAAFGPPRQLQLLYVRTMTRLRAAHPRRPCRGHRRPGCSPPPATSASERFEPSVDAACRNCRFHRLCPLQPEGREVGRRHEPSSSPPSRSGGHRGRGPSRRSSCVAGAGTGKTTVMARRILHLVAVGPGPARPDPRADVHQQGRRPSQGQGPGASWAPTPTSPSAPTTPSARRLVADHAARARPPPRHPHPQPGPGLAAALRRVRRVPLRAPQDHARPRSCSTPPYLGLALRRPPGAHRGGGRADCERIVAGAGTPEDPRHRAMRLRAVPGGGGLRPAQAGAPPARLRRPDRPRRAAAHRAPRGGRRPARPAPGRPARRVPGHQLRPAPAPSADLPARLRGHRGGRRHAVDLRLPGRPPGQHPRFGEHFPPRRRRAALQTTFRFGPRLVTLANRIQAKVDDSPAQGAARAGATRPTHHRLLPRRRRRRGGEPPSPPTSPSGWPTASRAAALRCCAGSAGSSRRSSAALEERGIPVEVIGASGLLDRPEIVDLVAWFELLADDGATRRPAAHPAGPPVPHRRCATWPPWPATPGRRDDRTWLADPRRLDAVADAVRRGACAGCGGFMAERAVLAAAATRMPVLELAETIVERTGLWRAAGDLGRENLLRFLDLAEGFTPWRATPGCGAFVEYLQLLDESDDDLAEAHLTDADAVKVMTIHQAKGLEFDDVYVPGLAGQGSSRIFPDIRGGENALTNGRGPALVAPARTTASRPGRRTAQKEVEEVDPPAPPRRGVAPALRGLHPGPAPARLLGGPLVRRGRPSPRDPREFYDFVAAPDRPGHRAVPPRAGRASNPDVAAKERQRAAARRYADPVPPRPAARRPSCSLDAVVDAGRAPRPGWRRRRSRSPALVTYARCPKQFYWTVVRPLPRRRRPPPASAPRSTAGSSSGPAASWRCIEPEPDADLRRPRPGPGRRRRRRRPAGVVPGQPVGRPRPGAGGGALRARWSAATSCGAASTRSTSATAAWSWSTSRPAGRRPPATGPPARQLDLYAAGRHRRLGAPTRRGCAPPTATCGPTGRRSWCPPTGTPAAVAGVRARLAATLDAMAEARFGPRRAGGAGAVTSCRSALGAGRGQRQLGPRFRSGLMITGVGVGIAATPNDTSGASASDEGPRQRCDGVPVDAANRF